LNKLGLPVVCVDARHATQRRRGHCTHHAVWIVQGSPRQRSRQPCDQSPACQPSSSRQDQAAGCAKPTLPWLESLLSLCTGCGSKAANSSGPQRTLLISLHSRTTEFPPTSGSQRPSPALGTLAVSDIEAMGVDNGNFCAAGSGNFSAKQGRPPVPVRASMGMQWRLIDVSSSRCSAARPPGQSRRSRNVLGALAG